MAYIRSLAYSHSSEDDDVGEVTEETQLGRVTAQTQRPHRLDQRGENPPTNAGVDHRQRDLCVRVGEKEKE